MLRLQLILILAFNIGLLFGCGPKAIDKPLHQFPSAEKLRAISKVSQSTQPLSAEYSGFDAWTLELPGPRAENPAADLLAIATPRASRSAALDCVAHELARMVVQSQEERPRPSLRGFVSARCGADIAIPSYQTFVGEASPAASDAAIVAQMRARLSGPLDAQAREAGAAIVRSGKKVVLAVAFGTPLSIATFEQVVGDRGVFNARGRVQFDTDSVEAYINVGEFGVERCRLDPAVAAPFFAVSCQLAAADDHARVDVVARPRGQVLARHVLSVVAVRHGDAAKRYQSRMLGQEGGSAESADFEATAVELLNRVRSGAGLAPLKAAPAQSRVANSVTPALLGALTSSEPDATEVGNTIILGLLAGWDVDGGIIQDASLATSVSIDTTDPRRWLADATEQPMGRMVLFDPAARAIALGVSKREEPALLGVVSVTYRFFQDESDPLARATRLLDRLARVRAARDLGRTVLVRDAPGMDEELLRIREGATTPSAALDVLMHKMSAEVHREVRGFIWETQDLDAIEFPKELMQKGDIVIGAGITHHRAKGGAWGQYSVLFVVVPVPQGLKT